MNKQTRIDLIIDSIEEMIFPLSILNEQLESIIYDKEIPLSQNEYDILYYYYMQVNGTGFLQDLKDIVKLIDIKD